MTTYIITFVVFLAAVTGMAVGVMLSGRRIQGSCGGLGNLRDATGKPMCESCDAPSPECSGDPNEVTRDHEPTGV